jgi:phosphoribosylformylglycinamidine cyclo-ligase
MPGIYKSGEYDIAGFCVGVVEKKNIIDGSRIKRGDLVIGLESNGLHSNGFSLVRKVLSKRELKCMSNVLLKPTRIYVKPVLKLLQTPNSVLPTGIKGIAHITGGAFYDKIARILPKNVNALIYQGSWPVPRIFKIIQSKGNISDKEIYHTLNMGIGMVLIVAPGAVRAIQSRLKIKSWVIGEIVKGKKKVEII